MVSLYIYIVLYLLGFNFNLSAKNKSMKYNNLDKGSAMSLLHSEGKVIKGINLFNKGLFITFKDSVLKIFDDGQSCCEYRYMHTEDDLKDYIGTTFKSLEKKEHKRSEIDTFDILDSQFLDINTSKGLLQICS